MMTFTQDMLIGVLDGTNEVEVTTETPAGVTRTLSRLTVVNADSVSHSITLQIYWPLDGNDDRVVDTHTVRPAITIKSGESAVFRGYSCREKMFFRVYSDAVATDSEGEPTFVCVWGDLTDP